ncbi:MAG: hypothetical protein R3321_15385 [Nitrososphaeraceae archaeon]|nr:hypothetical protein [Nitrososphaeraceae archaeon]
MNKSKILLLGLVVILLSNSSGMELVSNVMGDNTFKDLDNTDFTQRYEKFYKDDSFRESYYNHHKLSHHQGEHQQDLEVELKHTILDQPLFMLSISPENMDQQKINLQQLLTPRK